MATVKRPFPQAGDWLVSATGLSYELGDHLGGGGFGRAYACTDEFDLEMVAKYLRPKGKKRVEVMAAWEREVALMAKVRHPHVVRIYDAFEHDGRFWLVMERCEGTVRELIDATPGGLGFADEQVVDFGRQILSAVNAIHAADIIHRDLHVDNVFYTTVENGFALKVSDFGISKQLLEDEGDHAYTRIGRAYELAPELVTLGYTSQQSDIYQVGLLLYHLLTGKPAVSSKDGPPLSVIPSALARRRAEALNTPLGDVIAVMLRRREEYRYASALDAWQDLAAL